MRASSFLRTHAASAGLLAVASIAMLASGVDAGCAAGGDELGHDTTANASVGASTGPGPTTGSGPGSTSSSGAGAGGTTTSTTSSSNGGAGGMGAGGMGGAGGAGTTSTTTGAGGAGGGGATGTVLVLAGSPAKLFAGAYHPGGSWTTTTLAGGTTASPALAIAGDGRGVGVMRSASDAGALVYTVELAGAWQPLLGVGAGITTRATPAIASAPTGVDVVFHGDDFKHYFGAFTAAWTPSAEPVGPAGQQAFGPSPAAIVRLGSDDVAVYAGNDGDLYDQTRKGGAWQAGHAHALGNVTSMTPAVVALTSGPELLVVFVKNDGQVQWTTRNAGTWSAPADVEGATTQDRVALAATPGGGAVLAMRDLAGKLMTSIYTPGGSPAWSPPAPLANPDPAVPATPALATGVGGADAELAYIDQATGGVFHARLTSGAFSAPVLVGGAGLSTVAIASAP